MIAGATIGVRAKAKSGNARTKSVHLMKSNLRGSLHKSPACCGAGFWFGKTSWQSLNIVLQDVKDNLLYESCVKKSSMVGGLFCLVLVE